MEIYKDHNRKGINVGIMKVTQTETIKFLNRKLYA